MFLRIKRSGKYQYLQIVKNTRRFGLVQQKVIASLGRVDNFLGKEDLFDLGTSCIEVYDKLKSKPGKNSLINILEPDDQLELNPAMSEKH